MHQLIGAHTSASGGVYNALINGHEINAGTIQLFTSNQKQWKGRTYKKEELDLWFEHLEKTQIKKVMSHASYLINLGCPNEINLIKSRTAFLEEIERCNLLKLTYLNFHPGAALKESVELCLDTIVESLLQTRPLFENSDLRLLLEATAGQGSNVGHSFEQLGYIVEKTKDHIPIGVCIDTCHIFAASYDLRTYEDWDNMLKTFETHVGLKHLYALHVNDSKFGLGSRKDRHAPLGEGEIGIEGFKAMMQHPALMALPKYLETPGGMPAWKEEIALLKTFASNKKKV
ncbi:MAG: Endonuclease 4 [Chlamydiae bacterium]|nr:Endonuclease 4 [Chlamydiota bacterium]